MKILPEPLPEYTTELAEHLAFWRTKHPAPGEAAAVLLGLILRDSIQFMNAVVTGKAVAYFFGESPMPAWAATALSGAATERIYSDWDRVPDPVPVEVEEEAMRLVGFLIRLEQRFGNETRPWDYGGWISEASISGPLLLDAEHPDDAALWQRLGAGWRTSRVVPADQADPVEEGDRFRTGGGSMATAFLCTDGEPVFALIC